MYNDIFRRFPLRLMGFSFGIAEALAYRYSSDRVEMCYELGTYFIICHVAYTGIKSKSGFAMFNSMAFESICSCLIPPMVISYVCAYVADKIVEMDNLPMSVRKWGPLAAGVLAVPVLALCIDPLVELFLDELYPSHSIPSPPPPPPLPPSV